MKKKLFTEEELAAYIDGTLSESRMDDLESSLTDDTLELIGVTRTALGMSTKKVEEPVTEKADKGNFVTLPDWADRKPSSNVFTGSWGSQVAMAGFLGDVEEDDDDGPENDDQK